MTTLKSTFNFEHQVTNLKPLPTNHKRSESKGTAHDFWKHYQERPLDAIFRPTSVAVVGASEKEGSVGRTLIWNLLRSPFGGTIYPINSNPRHENIFGIPCFNRLQDLTDQLKYRCNDVSRSIDLVIIAVPAKAVKQVMHDCVEVGVKGCIIISAGFKETGEEGAKLEREIHDIARAGKIRVVGPNCLGVMNPITGMNATFANNLAKPGNVAFVSQSGAMCTSILDWSLQANVGFSAFLSIGSMMDVNWGDIIYYLGDDPNTKAIAIYMETIGDARSFMSAASEVAMTKPIIVIKPGRTVEASKAAVSHTGSLSGRDDVLDAAFKRCGVLRVSKIREVFEMVELLGKQPRPRGKYLTIITNAGGPGVISTDALIDSGGGLAWISDHTMKQLNDVLPSHWSHANPIDILGDATPSTYSRVLEIAAEDSYSDGILIVLTPQSMTDPTATAKEIAAVVKKIGGRKPVLASWMGGQNVAEGRSILDAAGIPTYDYPDSASEMFSFMWKHSVNLSQLYETPRWCTEMHPESLGVDAIISNAQDNQRTVLTELESKQILAAYGIQTVQTVLCSTAEEAASAADSCGYPVVVKINSYIITHKTDVGGVRLNLNSAEQVKEAFNKIRQNIEAQYPMDGKSAFSGVTVQPMIRIKDAYELIIGSSPDDQFGPTILFGSGGSLVEVYDDKSLALPPLNSNLAHLMMKETRIYKALKGVRGKNKVDIAAIENLLVNFSHLVSEKWSLIKEIEINPLLVSADKLIALDARVILHDTYHGVSKASRPAIRPYPTTYDQGWVSKKGKMIRIRAIMPEDEPLIVDFHKRLSEHSVYTRFFSDLSFKDRTSHDRLKRVCHVDYDRDIALVALDDEKCSKSQSKLVAAARLTKEHGVNVAEFSILVADAYQGQGIGSKLLREVIAHAKSEGIDAIEAVVLPSNQSMVHVMEKEGFECIFDKDQGVARQYLNLNGSEEKDRSNQFQLFTEPILI